MNLEPKHYLILLAMVVAIGTQLAGLPHGWQDAMTPAFVGGLLVMIGTQLTSLFVGAPKQPWDGTLRRGADERAASAAIDKAAVTVAATTAAAITKAVEEVKP